MTTMDEKRTLRFASGEMDAVEESDFLARCEIAPESWREATLAVAEHRRLVEALGEIAAAGSIPSTAIRRAKPGRTSRQLLIVIATAAFATGLFLAIVGTRVSRFVRDRGTADVQVQPSVEGLDLAVAQETDAASTIVAGPSNTTLAGPGVHQTVLRSHDVEVKEEPTLYIITTENGTRWAIPTEQTTFCYANH
jgi:hypothetical protein